MFTINVLLLEKHKPKKINNDLRIHKQHFEYTTLNDFKIQYYYFKDEHDALMSTEGIASNIIVLDTELRAIKEHAFPCKPPYLMGYYNCDTGSVT